VQNSVTYKIENNKIIDNHVGKMSKMHRIVEVVETSEGVFDVDLSPYKNDVKLHIKFPSARNTANITVNIIGILERNTPLESIMMSGLDEEASPSVKGAEFLSLEKRGTITFTLDSQDYAFPESICHFGSFATGGYPERIFLDIDFIEGGNGSTNKYMIHNGIFGFLELWNLAMPQESLGSYKNSIPYPDQDNTAFLLKTNGNTPVKKDFYIRNVFPFGNLYDTDFNIYLYTHLHYNFDMPIINGTGLYQKNRRLIIGVLQYLTPAWTKNLVWSFKPTDHGGENYLSFENVVTGLADSNGVSPTDVAFFQIAVYGEYLRKQAI
jgi:hypothetical protein